MRLNILLLMMVLFLPFPTKLMAEAISKTDEVGAAVIFYGLTLLAISVVTSGLWRYVASRRDLLEPGVTDEDVTAITGVTAPNMGFYAVVLLLALLAPQVAAFGYLLSLSSACSANTATMLGARLNRPPRQQAGGRTALNVRP